MAEPGLLDQFCGITGATEAVAEHVLEAHGGDLNAAVNFYLESGGVGFGTGGGMPNHTGFELPAVSGPLPAATAGPNFSPIEVGQGACNGGKAGSFSKQALWLLFTLKRGQGVNPQTPCLPPPQPHSPHHARMPTQAPVTALQLMDSEDEGMQVLANNLRRRAAAPSPRGDPDSEVEYIPSSSSDGEGDVGIASRRARRNRQRAVAAAAARDATSLGFGAQRAGRGGSAGDLYTDLSDFRFRVGAPARDRMGGPAGTVPPARPYVTRDHEEDGDYGEGGAPELPGDVDMEEQRMLMAALTGTAYGGHIPGV
jgi:hypothetical protein